MPDLPPPYVPGEDEEGAGAPPEEARAPEDDAGSPEGAARTPAEPTSGGRGAADAPAESPGAARAASRREEAAPPAAAAEGPDALLPDDVRRVIRDVPDFPRPGILFRDVTPVFADPELFRRVSRRLAREARRRGAERVAGIESRGFLLGTPVALMLDVPFVTVRKEGKLPGETRTVSYDLEYGSGHLEVQADAIAPGERVVVVDDLLATGGTAAGAAELLEGLDGTVAGMCFLIELAALHGRNRLGRYNTFSILEL